MTPNPYAAPAVRWLRVVLGAICFVLSAMLVWQTLSSGAADGCFSRRCIPARMWTAQEYPTQFWFYILFWVTIGGISGRTAWRAWRE